MTLIESLSADIYEPLIERGDHSMPIPPSGTFGWLAEAAQKHPDKTAVADWLSRQSFTFAELHSRVEALAHYLQSRGVNAGDRVLLISTNSPAFIEVMFAIWRLEAIFVPLNHRLSPEEVRAQRNDCGASFAFVADQFSPHIDVTTSPVPHLIIPDHTSSRELRAEYDAIADSRTRVTRPLAVASNDVCAIIYTSGTTGCPKGAMLTHDNFAANARHAELTGLTSDDVSIVVAPLFHIGGLSIQTLPLLRLGGTNVILGPFAPASWTRAANEWKATVAFAVPRMWLLLDELLDASGDAFPPLHLALVGGASCPASLVQSLRRHGITLSEGFGMTETSPIVAYLEPEHVAAKVGSVGRPVGDVQVRIVDEHNEDVPVGVGGELLIAGPNVFAGYWNAQQETAESFTGKWFHSGDIAIMDNEGFLTIAGRMKDIIITGGENVLAAEVERVLAGHPDVKEAAVIGIPDEEWGERIVAAITLQSDRSPTYSEMRDWCRDRLARFKCPKEVIRINELPRNSTGKVDKNTLTTLVGQIRESGANCP